MPVFSLDWIGKSTSSRTIALLESELCELRSEYDLVVAQTEASITEIKTMATRVIDAQEVVMEKDQTICSLNEAIESYAEQLKQKNGVVEELEDSLLAHIDWNLERENEVESLSQKITDLEVCRFSVHVWHFLEWTVIIVAEMQKSSFLCVWYAYVGYIEW